MIDPIPTKANKSRLSVPSQELDTVEANGGELEVGGQFMLLRGGRVGPQSKAKDTIIFTLKSSCEWTQAYPAWILMQWILDFPLDRPATFVASYARFHRQPARKPDFIPSDRDFSVYLNHYNELAATRAVRTIRSIQGPRQANLRAQRIHI